MKSFTPSPYRSERSSKILNEEIRVPGDKSISHRAVMLGGLAIGQTRITGLLEGQDVLASATAMRALGARIDKHATDDKQDVWICSGNGTGGLEEPRDVLDLGNSGTSARLLMGLVAGYPFTSVFTGDDSLRSRPMGRVITPLSRMGARFLARQDDKFPLCVKGSRDLLCLNYETPVASAQIKSAILLAGLMARGQSCVIESRPSRDHTENMLRGFGAHIETGQDGPDRYYACVTGEPELTGGHHIHVPADPSSAAFPAAAASLNSGAGLVLKDVGINPRRTGFFQTIEEMGVQIEYLDRREEGGEPVADMRLRAPEVLRAVDVPGERVPSMIDEFPVLAMLAACAEGTSRMYDLAELRVKESDRLALIAKGLQDCGTKVEIEKDNLIIHGNGKPPQGGAHIHTELDHRIAMSFLVLGSVTRTPVEIDDIGPVATSFPGFVDLMNKIGLKISPSGKDKDNEEGTKDEAAYG